MISRPVTRADLPEVHRLSCAVDTHWFGAPEADEAELVEGYELLDSPETDTMLLLDGERAVACAWWMGDDTHCLIHPEASPDTHSQVIAGFASQGRNLPISALSQNAALIGALNEAGWVHVHSAFELIREVDPGWVIAPPTWPSSIRLSGLESPERVHDLIYRRARWSDIPGHPERSLPDWQRLFFPESVKPDQHILAWEGDDLVGVAVGRMFADGAGWVSQLAVPVEHRGRGLGRSLLLAAMHRHAEAGATRLGLQVSAKNREAIRLYLGVGLLVDREWREFRAVAG